MTQKASQIRHTAHQVVGSEQDQGLARHRATHALQHGHQSGDILGLVRSRERRGREDTGLDTVVERRVQQRGAHRSSQSLQSQVTQHELEVLTHGKGGAGHDGAQAIALPVIP